MREIYEVLHEREAELARVRHEIESLKIVATLLLDDSGDEATEKRSTGEKTSDGTPFGATGTDGLFSSNPDSRPGFWKALRWRK